MKNIIIAIICVFSAGTLSAQEMTAGIWNTGEDKTLIETYEKDGAWFGKIISSDNPKAKIGLEIIRDVQHDGDEWVGKLFAAKRNKLVDAVIKPTNEILDITVSMGFFKKELTWKRDQETKSY